jgi:hypothetical protein
MAAKTDNSATRAGWIRRNRARVQAAVLVTLIGLSFALHAALSAGQNALAAVCFAVIALCMALTVFVS